MGEWRKPPVPYNFSGDFAELFPEPGRSSDSLMATAVDIRTGLSYEELARVTYFSHRDPVRVRISDLKFSQDSCSLHFKDRPDTLFDLADSLGVDTRRRDVPMLEVFWDGDTYHSLDHR